MEVIVSTDSSSQLWNCTVTDLHSGASLVSYRGGNTSARGLAVLDGRWLLGAQLGKNFINVWEIQRKVVRNNSTFTIVYRIYLYSSNVSYSHTQYNYLPLW